MGKIKVLHFADAHIDIANYGRLDPTSGLPVRVMDFLHALDQIITAAVNGEVDLVIFAGDAYKDRNPQPTFQREWGKRMMQLSAAGIPTILLVGNHDVAPAAGRAHTLEEFKTFAIPHIHVADRLAFFGPDELGVAAQVIAIPWISPGALMTRQETAGKSTEEILTMVETRLLEAFAALVEKADPELPLILTAHASVQGAKFGSERQVMLGHELVLGGGIINHPKLDYVALGHIHKHQELSGGFRRPIVYPGSIERIDFGEAKERKGYVMVSLNAGAADSPWEFCPLETRRFINLNLDTPDADQFMADIMAQLPDAEMVKDAICRVQLHYPREWEPRLDEQAIRNHFNEAFSIQIQKQLIETERSRLGDTVQVETMTPLQLLDKYWQVAGLEEAEAAAMQSLAKELLGGAD